MAQQFEIVPYEGAGNLRLRSSRNEVESILGPPEHFQRTDYLPKMRLNPVYEASYGLIGVNLAYDLDYKLTYICFSQQQKPFDGIVSYQGINVFADADAFDRLIDHDSKPFEWVGFIMLMKLGLRLSGFHDSSDSGRCISLFERGRYDSKTPKFSPYQPKNRH